MQTDSIHFFAMPFRLLPELPGTTDDLQKSFLYRRSLRKRRINLICGLDTSGNAIPRRKVPMAHRKLAPQGIIDGHYGWPRSQFIMSFVDWTIYGRGASQEDMRSDEFILTRDFIAHVQRGQEGQIHTRPIKDTRYGVPFYKMDGGKKILPIYLRNKYAPPTSSHQRLAMAKLFNPQLKMIQHLSGISHDPDLIWLPGENYL